MELSGLDSKEIILHFKQSNSHQDSLYALDKWQEYEEANPRAFAGMYQFWCQKAG